MQRAEPKVKQKCFRRRTGFIDDFTHFFAADAIHKADGQRGYVVHCQGADIYLSTKGRNM